MEAEGQIEGERVETEIQIEDLKEEMERMTGIHGRAMMRIYGDQERERHYEFKVNRGKTWR